MATTGFENLKGENLEKAYRGLSALTAGVTPDKVLLPAGLDDSTLQLIVKNKAAAFDRNQNQYVLNKNNDLDNPKASPKDNFITKAKSPETGDSFVLHAMLVTNGYDASFDGKYSEQELKDLKELATRYEAGKSTLDNRGLVQDFNNSTAAKNYAVEQQHGLVENGLKALGYPPKELTNKVTTHYQTALQEHSEDLFGSRMNIHEIDSLISRDPAAAAKAVGYVVSQGDHREQVAKMLQTNDPDQIKQAQAILRLNGAGDVNVTGKYDSATAQAAKDYVETPKGLSSEANHYHKGGLSPTRIEINLNNGSIPIVAGALPKQLMNIENEAFRNEQLSVHLSNPKNFAQYSAHLKGAYTQGLTQKYSAQLGKDVAELKQSENKIEKFKSDRVELTTLGKKSADDHDTLTKEQIVLSDAVESESLASGTIYASLTSDLPINASTPSEVKKLVELKQNIDSAESALTQYRRSPIELNKKHGVIGLDSVRNSSIDQSLDNSILKAQNNYLDSIAKLTDPQKGTALAYIEKNSPTYAIANQTAGEKPTIETESSGGLMNWASKKLSGMFDGKVGAPDKVVQNDALDPSVRFNPKVYGME